MVTIIDLDSKLYDLAVKQIAKYRAEQDQMEMIPTPNWLLLEGKIQGLKDFFDIGEE